MPLDHPFNAVVKKAEELINRGAKVFQKWTCEKCGSRQTMPDANHFYTSGICEECKHITDIQARGCNFMTLYSPKGGDTQKVADFIAGLASELKK